MLLSQPLASLIIFFWTSSIKFHHNSQRVSDSFYHSLTTVETESNCHFEIIEPYQPVLALFPFS